MGTRCPGEVPVLSLAESSCGLGTGQSICSLQGEGRLVDGVRAEGIRREKAFQVSKQLQQVSSWEKETGACGKVPAAQCDQRLGSGTRRQMQFPSLGLGITEPPGGVGVELPKAYGDSSLDSSPIVLWLFLFTDPGRLPLRMEGTELVSGPWGPPGVVCGSGNDLSGLPCSWVTLSPRALVSSL